MAVHLTRVFAAPPERLWRAWTVELADWFGAPGTKAKARLDAVVGGDWSLRMRVPGGAGFGFSGRYLELEEPSRLVFTMIADGQDGVETCTVAITPEGTGAQQSFAQEGGSLTPEQYEQATAGWAVFFERLDALTRP